MVNKYKVLQPFDGHEVDSIIELDQDDAVSHLEEGRVETHITEEEGRPVDATVESDGTATPTPPAPADAETEAAREPAPAGGEDRAREAAIEAGQDVEIGTGTAVPPASE